MNTLSSPKGSSPLFGGVSSSTANAVVNLASFNGQVVEEGDKEMSTFLLSLGSNTPSGGERRKQVSGGDWSAKRVMAMRLEERMTMHVCTVCSPSISFI
jgi:hypothetical protein